MTFLDDYGVFMETNDKFHLQKPF